MDGVDRAVSTKTLDPSLPTYDGKPKAIESKLNKYLDDLDGFTAAEHTSNMSGADVRITKKDYDTKVLEVFVRPDTMNDESRKAIDRVRARAEEKGIVMEVHEYP